MTLLLAIDPGPIESAYVLIHTEDCSLEDHDKTHNELLLELIHERRFAGADAIAIEMIASYGMPVGADVFETCVWIGRFTEALIGGYDASCVPNLQLVKRHPVKLHHCHSGKATDSNIRRALADRFAPRQPNFGKGTKTEPGWFHGFHADIWAAYAVAVYAADHLKEDQ